MSKLFDDASLAMIPSAYKDGKLYSIRPTDGSGDFTFSRGSNLAATRVDVNGLIEKGRENLFTNSNNLPNVTLDKLTRTTGHADPFGGSNAALFTEDTNTGSHRFYIFNIPATDAVYTYSIYAKPNGRNRFQIVADGGGINAQFNIADGTLIGDSNEIVSNIQSVGDGWYRISLTYYGAGWIGGYFFNDGGSNNYTGDGTSGVYLYGAQVEAGLVATDYIETGASTAQAGILEDMPRLDYSGSCPALLLEPQRTNLVTNSEYFASPPWSYYPYGGGSLVRTFGYESPSGANDAYKFDVIIGTGGILLTENITATASVDYTLSVWMKGEVGGEKVQIDFKSSASSGPSGTNFTLTTEWKRYDVSVTNDTGTSRGFQFRCTASNVPSDQTFYVWGAQLEQGSYPTSYIPTYGTSQTRLGGMFRNTSLNLQDDGILGSTWTFLYDNTYVDVVRDAGANLFQIESVTSGEYVRISLNSGGTYRLQDGDGTIANTSGNKILGRYDGTKVEFFVDGASVGSRTSTAGRYSDLDRFEPSTSVTKIVKLNQLLFFPTALTDSECIALTTL